MPPRELAPNASAEYAYGYYTAWRQQSRDSPYYNRAQTERFKRGYDQAEMEGALANMPTPPPSEESTPLAIVKLVACLIVLFAVFTAAGVAGSIWR